MVLWFDEWKEIAYDPIPFQKNDHGEKNISIATIETGRRGSFTKNVNPSERNENKENDKISMNLSNTSHSSESDGSTVLVGPTSSSTRYQQNNRPQEVRPSISYEQFMWVTSTTITLLFILDRFLWNLWPRQTFSIGAGTAGSDRMQGFKPGPWSVVLYDVIARLSGRFSILCYNLLLLTRLESFEDFLGPSSFVAKNLLDCSDIVNANLRLHKFHGILLCVLTLLHVWSILFPCVFHGYSATVVPGKFEWPLSERTPIKCSVEDVPGCWPGDANPDLKQMGLQIDDVFRMVEMTIFLAILMPLSIKWMASRWHAAIHLHRFIHIVYFVDIVRRHSHPHSWVLNSPMFALYVLDKWLYSNYWRRNDTPEINKVPLGNNYMVLYWKSPFGITDTICPHYSLRLKNGSSWFENKHVFTCFENRINTMELQCNEKSDLLKCWTVGAVVRVFNNVRKPKIGDPISHTKRIYDTTPDSLRMLITGPRQGEMSEQLKYSFLRTSGGSLEAANRSNPLVVIGTGSAINYIIDMLLWLLANDSVVSLPTTTKVVYSTRDSDLFRWVVKSICQLLTSPEYDAKKYGHKLIMNFSFTGSSLADRDHGDHEEQGGEWFEELRREAIRSNISISRRRIALEPMIDQGSTVFCQGSAGLKKDVESVCEKNCAKFYGGRGGGA